MVINIPEFRVDVQLFIQINTIYFRPKKRGICLFKPVSDHWWAKPAPKDEPSPFGHFFDSLHLPFFDSLHLTFLFRKRMLFLNVLRFDSIHLPLVFRMYVFFFGAHASDVCVRSWNPSAVLKQSYIINLALLHL